MRKTSKTIYNIATYVYLGFAILFAVFGILYCSAFIIGKTNEEIAKNVGKGIGLLIASSIACGESIFARRALLGKSPNTTALVWGIIGVVAAYSVGTLLVIGAIFGLVADNQEKGSASTSTQDVIDEPKDEE